MFRVCLGLSASPCSELPSNMPPAVVAKEAFEWYRPIGLLTPLRMLKDAVVGDKVLDIIIDGARSEAA